MTRLCSTPGCGETIADRSRTGICRACAQIERTARQANYTDSCTHYITAANDVTPRDALRIHGVRI